MAELKFLSKLDTDQLEYARQIAVKAKEMGVPPALAIAFAYKESSLRPDTSDSSDGAVGLMQVLPKTARGHGYTEKELRDPAKNIEIGLKNIKEGLEYTGNDPKLTAVYYHSGPDAITALAEGKAMGPRTKEYVKTLNELGAFDFSTEAPATQPATQPEAPKPSQDGEAKVVTTEQDFIRPNSAADLRRQEYGLAGAGAGAALKALPYVGTTAAGTAGRIVRAFNEAKAPITAPTGGLPTVTAPTTPQTPPNAPMGGLPTGQVPSVVRQGAPATGYGTYNYGLSQGLTPIESGLALDMTKEQGGVHDLLTQRREAMNKLQSMGANNFVENPRFGGIMTQAPSVGGGVKVDPTTGVPQSFAMRVPEGGQTPQLAPIPKASPIPTVAPLPSGLDQAKSIFLNIMRGGAKLLPYAGLPLAGLSIGRDVADIESQYDRPLPERDYTDIGLSAAGALATGASLTPAYPVALPLSVGIPAYRNIRRSVLAQESDPEIQRFIKSEPTAEELSTASRPFIGYPSIR